jgi:hypothetical protein
MNHFQAPFIESPTTFLAHDFSCAQNFFQIIARRFAAIVSAKIRILTPSAHDSLPMLQFHSNFCL